MTRRVAITGFSFRFPGTDKKQYWQDLLQGKDLVTEVEQQRWAQDAFKHPNKNNPGTGYTNAAGSIGDISMFDAGFFGISPREASMMDPQQRMLLEMSWEALENSGIKPSSVKGSNCGVFIGIASADYSYRLADDLAAVDSSVATGNTSSIAANRISYVLDLHGPSMAIDTACSSSMVAFHQACRSITSGETTQAITGGVSLHLHPYGFIVFSKASMLSRKGRCNVFDASGDGYVRSEGGGIFFLKDYDQAIADGNPILAVVANSAVNTDGRKSGITVPSAPIQAALLEQAYRQAGISPEEIDYLEAHGTGTAVGDPIESNAIGNALGKHRSRDNPLPIGSVKSNMGHLEAASGVAGLVKAIQSMQTRTVPATIGIRKLNPAIPFDDLNIRVVTENLPLKAEGKIVIGVNSFGFGGANAHIILQSHEPPVTRTANVTTPIPLLISAKDSKGLKHAAHDMAIFLASCEQKQLYEVAFNALFHRDLHEHRAVTFISNIKDAASNLSGFANDMDETLCATESGTALQHAQGPAFIYSGNGSQWIGMGKKLLEEDPVFRQAVIDVDTLFRQYADYSLLDELNAESANNRYQLTEIAQPTLFAIQVGITEVLRHRGLMPAAVAGHSVGEVAAAWASGALSLPDAVSVIYHRSQLQETTRGTGEMTAVATGKEAAIALLSELKLDTEIAIAGCNSPRGITVAGNATALSLLEQSLRTQGILHKRLDLAYAFHSPAMDDIQPGVLAALTGLQPTQTRTPYYSTVTGKQLQGEALDAQYWWDNIRQPVLFEQAIQDIARQGINVFVEIGPHAILRSYIKDCLDISNIEARIISTMVRDDDSAARIHSAASQCLISGAGFDWENIFPVQARFISLPNYPWQRERHWHTVTPESVGLLSRHKQHALLGYPLSQHDMTWENQLDTKRNPMLADHVVGDSIVFPGSGYAELALAVAHAIHGNTILEIEELEIRTPLILNKDQSTLIRTVVDNKDGSLVIKGRPYNSDESWRVHATARILEEATDVRIDGNKQLIPTRPPDFNTEGHAALTRAAHLQYGPSFQCISHGWIQESEVLAALVVPATISSENEHSHLHPALLDCTFQLIIQLLQQDIGLHDGFTFVPVKMGRIILRHPLTTPAYAKARILHRSAHSLLGEFTLLDAQGTVVAVISEVRFRSVRLGRNAGDHLRFLDYRAIPKPHPSSIENAAILPFQSVRQAIAELARHAALKGTHRRYSEEVDPLLDSLCGQFIRQALMEVSDFSGQLTAQSLHELQNNLPTLAPYIEHLLKQASDDALLTPCENGWQITDSCEQPLAEDIWNSLVADYPDYFQIIHSVGRIGMHLATILQGRNDFASLCPRETSLVTLTRQIMGANGRQRTGEAIRKLVQNALKQLPEGRRLALLEISQGTPAYATDICTAGDAAFTDYTFASTAPGALEEIQHVREQFSHVRTHLIDGQPGNGSSHTHLTIVTLDFDSLDMAKNAVRHAHDQMVPDATLILIGHHPSRWVDFVFGAQTNYWTTDIPPLSAQHGIGFWQKQLSNLGFHDVAAYELSPDTLSGPFMLVARANKNQAIELTSAVTPRSWIVLSDRTGPSSHLSDHLATTLQQHGDLVVQTHAEETEALSDLLQETTRLYGKLDGIIHLSGLSQAGALTDTDQLLATQTRRCALAASIVQACENTQTATRCWLITSGATDVLRVHTSHNQGNTEQAIAADSAVWGFGRTLINEAADCRFRMIDIASTEATPATITALVRELQASDEEDEIILTAEGARYAPRLQLKERPQLQATAIDSATIRLNFQLPGQLRNLRWEAHPRRQPDADEVEVEVHATGLNFRDVMYALGLLSDEAIENGFAGPTLGLEFSGIVRSTGSNVTGFAPGDKVVGFGPSSFANRVVTQANAVSHIPPGISFEAAATIPGTFFTVYYALHHLAQLQAGEKVLIHGAAGGVGIAAIQLAKWMGAEIYVTAGSDEKRDFLRLLGIEHIFDSRSLTFADEILSLTNGEGVDVVLNSLAGEAINRNFRVLKPFGRFLELGKRDFYENTKIGLRPFRNNISYFGIDADQLMQARPALTRKLFAEMMNLFTEGVLHPLPYHVFDAEDIVDAFRYMQQARQIGKIIVTYRNGIRQVHAAQTLQAPQLALAANASYLVTGGLGGFGLRTAEWLAEKGARHLILISRSGPVTDIAHQAIEKLQQQGVKIHAAACDITDQAALGALFSFISENMPPLHGIVHAATVIDDGLIRNMNAGQIKRVLEPKVKGAALLHAFSKNSPLDFFVLFSSATTLFGNPGQANYVAANSSLEALAHHRRMAGLPATCVRWGAIDDVGFLARNEKIKDALQNRMGGAALDSGIALQALEKMLLSDRSGLGVMELEWNALARFLPSAGAPKFSEIAVLSAEDDTDEESGTDIQRMLAELSEEQLHAALTDMIRAEVGEILRVSTDKIDPAKSIYDMGLDSLMGVELVVALEARFGIRLPVMAISQSPTILKLAERITQQLRESENNNDTEEKNQESDVILKMRELADRHGQTISEESISILAEDLQSADGNNRIIH